MQNIIIGEINKVRELYSMVEINGEQLDISILKMDMLERGIEEFIVEEKHITGDQILTVKEMI